MTDQENTSILRSTVNFHQGITLRFRAWSLQTREEIFFPLIFDGEGSQE